MFIIKNQDGTVAKNRKIKHKQNSFFDEEIKSKKNSMYNKNQILSNAKKHLGGKYVWGGTKPKGFDCSGYVQYLYKKEGISLPRTAYEQSKVGLYVARSELQKGDLLFFLTDKKRNLPITHVGMYIGNDKFIHAASKKKGIIISSLSRSKYNKIFVKAKRIIK
jgi:cell wall-associated NlpC family hydrolase